MKEREILHNIFEKVRRLTSFKCSEIIKKDIDELIKKIQNNKSLVSALATSLLKKIIEPSQDIRLHRTDFVNGYSARVLDTSIISPFFKEKFPKYANKESSFLTLATRERIAWTKEDGSNLKIRDKQLKESFLNIFEQIELYNRSPQEYLEYLFFSLIQLNTKEEDIYKKVENNQIGKKDISFGINIYKVVEILNKHFRINQSSRLPVIAIYSIYELLLPKFSRLQDKKLLPLQVHTSSDKHTLGDIEIYTKENKPFEIIEIKHNIPITKYSIMDIIKKIKTYQLNKYYILTTYLNTFENNLSEQEVLSIILETKQKYSIDIIANGVLTTIKYYLRFVDNYETLLDVYTTNLIKDAKNSTEIKTFHIEKWNEIISDIFT